MDLMQAGHIRLLVQNGTPVAMTAFNAALPESVQIGSVYTPPAMRAYQSLGFTQVGDYAQILFANPLIVGDPA